MSERTERDDAELLRLSPAERAERGVASAAVRDALVTVLREGDEAAKDLRGVHLPPITLDRLRIEGRDRHALDLRGATIEELSLAEAAFGMPIRLDDAEIGDLTLDGASVDGDLRLSGATVTGELSAFETTFRGDVVAEEARFAGRVTLDEAEFRGDVTFDDATFETHVEMRAAELTGDSNLLDDNSSFTGVAFEEGFDVRQSAFGFTHFERIEVDGPARAAEIEADGDVEFTGATFADEAEFAEITVREDAAFDEVSFAGPATFDGATFRGGERTREADATFADTTFADDASFVGASFRGAVFDGAAFDAQATFDEVAFGEDARFGEVRFDGPARFVESRFRGDGDFAGSTFADRCVFRGASFAGGANHVAADARFENVRFGDDADFHGVTTRTANFRATAFAGEIDFTDGAFTEGVEFVARGIDGEAFVDLTQASVRGGRIVQPADEWVHYDLTRASLGDVVLDAERERGRRELLDHFRFCLTEFTEFDGNEFDFGRHLAYLDRNDFTIHTFTDPPESSYAVEMTPGVAAETYLKAKQAARANGEAKIAGEFRVRRQRFARRENARVVRDNDAPLVVRLKNLGRVAENDFLGVTCGYGMRPLRIAGAFLVAPLVFVPLYALGGPTFATSAGQLDSLAALATSEGRATFFELVHFSYVSYTTIGYGNIGPQGALARLLAAAEAYLSVVLSALFVYALVKRSEL